MTATPRPRDVTDTVVYGVSLSIADVLALPDGHRVIVLPPGFVVVRDEPVAWRVVDGNGRLVSGPFHNQREARDAAAYWANAPAGRATPPVTVQSLYAPEDDPT